MKVGIVTLLGNNYGGILQAYALKKTLEKLDVEVVNINYVLSSDSKKLKIKDVVKKFIYKSRNNKFKEFKKLYLNLTEPINDIKQFSEEKFECDAYIAGSDQIWNQQIAMKDREVYFLSFINNAKKISYAASVGRDNIEDNEKGKIGNLLNRFDKISIREKTGVDLYQPLTKNKIENVLDPTLLLSNNEWDEIVNDENTINEEYIFSYTLGADAKTLGFIEAIASKLNKNIVEISYKKNFKNEIKNINTAGPKEFIGLVKNSKYVLTNSFHGMVFSILNKKEFFVFKRGKMNSRIYDLLKILNIEERILDIEKITDISEIDITAEIDYDKVYDILEKEKEKSLNFLKQALDIKE